MSQSGAMHGFDRDRLQRVNTHFDGYVNDRRLAGYQVLIERAGELVHDHTHGVADLESQRSWDDDTIVRIFSMTKPITSVAAMMLYEQGHFQLKDPVSKFIPSFGESRVYRSGNEMNPVTDSVTEPMLMWHLLTHTSGLTYGFHRQTITDALYRNAGYEWAAPPGVDLAGACDAWASLPLAFQPGTEWLYGVSTDVLGRVVEVISGVPLDEFFAEHILGPLSMTDTAFSVPEDRRERAAELYVRNPANGEAVKSPLPLNPAEGMDFLSGGGGLWGTASDYLRFARMLLNKGELDGVRLLGPRTVDFMTQNQLPGNADLEDYGRPLFAETEFSGVGFGLGFSVVMDPAANKRLSAPGTFAWGGAASTAFWCDPLNDLAVVFVTQLLPSSTYPIRGELSQLVYQALID